MKRHLPEEPFAPARHLSVRAAGYHFIARQEKGRVLRIKTPVAKLTIERLQQARQIRPLDKAMPRYDFLAARAEIAHIDARGFIDT